MPCASARGTISPHPCAFTRVVLPGAEKGRVGSRLVTSTGTSSGSRVLRRIACSDLSEGPIELGRQKVLRPENDAFKTRDDLKTSAENSSNSRPLAMLDHGQARGTEFRRPGFQLDTRDTLIKLVRGSL